MAKVEILADNGRTRLEMERNGQTLLFRPVGVIDEDINFSVIIGILKELEGLVLTIHFDLGEMTRINSCGVREWILMMERIPVQIKKVFIRMKEAFVEQVNMVGSMVGKGPVSFQSFYAPYACNTCQKDFSMLIDPAQMKASGSMTQAPAFKCPKCSGKLDFDWIEEEYFGFLTRLQQE